MVATKGRTIRPHLVRAIRDNPDTVGRNSFAGGRRSSSPGAVPFVRPNVRQASGGGPKAAAKQARKVTRLKAGHAKRTTKRETRSTRKAAKVERRTTRKAAKVEKRTTRKAAKKTRRTERRAARGK